MSKSDYSRITDRSKRLFWPAALLLTGILCSDLTKAAIHRQANDPPLLTPGSAIERELQGGQTHAYQITFAAGQYLQIVADQLGANIALVLGQPGDAPEIVADFVGSGSGQEILSLITKTACTCKLEVRSKAKTAGRYALRFEELREATAQDADRVNAYRMQEEARQFWSQGAAESMQKAAGKYGEALSAWRALGDRAGEAALLFVMGEFHFDLADAKKSFEAWDRALSLWRALGRRKEEARTLSNLGLLSYAKYEIDKALEQYNQALEIHRSEGDRYWEAESMNRIGWAYNSIDERQKSIEYYNLALPLRRSAGDRTGEAVVYNDLGRAYDALGEKQKAIEHYEQALKLDPPEENPSGAAVTLSRLGVVYDSMSEWQQALDVYGQAIQLLEKANDRRTMAVTLNNIGRVYANLGDYRQSLDHYDRALKLCRELRIRNGEASTLNNMGLVHRFTKDFSKAMEYYNQSLALSKSLNSRGGQSLALEALGVVHQDLGESRKALEFFEQALALRQAIGDKRGEASTLENIGTAWASLGDARKAHEYFSQALPLHRKVANQEGEASARIGLAQAKYDLGDVAEARAMLDQSIQLTESIRAKVAGQDLRVSYFAAAQRRYEQGIDLLMRMGDSAAALEFSEQAQARGLLDLLGEVWAGIREGADPALQAKKRTLQHRLNARAEAQTRLFSGKPDEAKASAVATEIADLTLQLQNLDTEIRRANPRYAALTQAQPLRAAEIRQLIDERTLLLKYALGERRSYLWVVSSVSISGHQLPPREEIEAAAKKLYDLMTARQSQADVQQLQRVNEAEAEYPAQAARLSRMLLGPVAEQLGDKRIVIVASGMLEYLPFGALPVPTGSGSAGERESRGKISLPAPLIANHEIVMLPSASVLGVIRREMASRPQATDVAAVFADPIFTTDDPRIAAAKKSSTSPALTAASSDAGSPLARTMRDFNYAKLSRLPFSRQEAEAALSYAPGANNLKALGFDANRRLITSADLSRYRLLHFATHGLLNSEHPELSGLVLSLVDSTGKPQDGFLRLHDIYDLKLNADLVVLSACQTGLGKQVRGEGLVGLTRGFMYAGAPRIVASLWQVNDVATAELMKHFYHGLLKEGLRPAAALRSAQLELMKQKRWASPYYWAPFVLQGEWK